MSQGNTEHRFYRGKQLQLLVGQFGARQVFGTADLLLTERHIMPGATKSFQLTTNMQRTLILAVGAGDTVALVNGCYGFNKKNHDFIIGYTGQHLDKKTGCYMLGNGYRAYSPELLRFIAPDAASPFGKGGINSYAYCSGDPVNCQDDSGHNPLASAFRWVANKITKVLPKEKTLIERREEARQTLQRHPSLQKFKPIADHSANLDELLSIKRIGQARDYMAETTTRDLNDPFVMAAYHNVEIKEAAHTSKLDSVLSTYKDNNAASSYSQPPSPTSNNRSIRGLNE